MSDSASIVRKFAANASDRSAARLGERDIVLMPGVEGAEQLGLSAYSAIFGRGERAPLPAPYEEIWVVLHGRLRIRSGGERLVADAGDYLHIPQDSPGEVEALETTTLVCISVPPH